MSTRTAFSDGASNLIELLPFSRARRLTHLHRAHTPARMQGQHVCCSAPSTAAHTPPSVTVSNLRRLYAVPKKARTPSAKCPRREPASAPPVLGGPGSAQSSQQALLIQSDRYPSRRCPADSPKKSCVKSPSSRKLQHTLPFCSSETHKTNRTHLGKWQRNKQAVKSIPRTGQVCARALPVSPVTPGVRDTQGGWQRSCADTHVPGFNTWRGLGACTPLPNTGAPLRHLLCPGPLSGRKGL